MRINTARVAVKGESATTSSGAASSRFVVHGRKIWISTAQGAHKILKLARTTPIGACQSHSQGQRLFYTAGTRIEELPVRRANAVQNEFLTALLQDRASVAIYLANGVSLRGHIEFSIATSLEFPIKWSTNA